jgi:outer membrane autotransporter protein
MAEPGVFVEAPVAEPAPRGGLWVKGTGAWTEQDTEVTVVDPAPFTFDTSFDQDTFSVLAGADFGPGTYDGGFRVGLFGGYATSDLDFAAWDATAEYSGGIVGGYVAFTSGAFYIDATLKADLLEMTYASPSLGAGVEVDADATSVGVRANTGYRMEGERGFFEPIASFAFVDTDIDGFTAGGATVSFGNGQSVRAGAGARVGVSLGEGGASTTELSLLGKVWNEFEDANTVTISDGMGSSATFEDDISGVFGEVTGTATMYSADRSFSGFVSGGALFNSDFTTWTAKAGLRKAL